MTQKEAIEILKEAIRDTEGYASWHEAHEALEVVRQPKKPVVPKWFDEYAEEYLQDEESLIGKVETYIADIPCRFTEDELEYLKEHEREILTALIDGYEVEKEQLYWVRDKNGKSLIFRNRIDDKISTSCGNGLKTQEEEAYRYQFTEQEIKDYDERYWAFAVPVEEVRE